PLCSTLFPYTTLFRSPNKSAARRRQRIHVWVPDYASAIGGIQTFSRFIVRALRDVFPDTFIAVFSKNDTSYPDLASDPANSFTPDRKSTRLNSSHQII